jgi:hypothetical protein
LKVSPKPARPGSRLNAYWVLFRLDRVPQIFKKPTLLRPGGHLGYPKQLCEAMMPQVAIELARPSGVLTSGNKQALNEVLEGISVQEEHWHHPQPWGILNFGWSSRGTQRDVAGSLPKHVGSTQKAAGLDLPEDGGLSPSLKFISPTL